MHKVTDEQLMAFADGELPTADRDRLAVMIAGSSELQEQVERFRLTRAPLARAFDDVWMAPVPAELVRLVNEGMPPSESRARRATQPAGNSFRVIGQLRQLFLGGSGASGLPFGVALAGLAGVAILAGLGGWFLHGEVSGMVATAQFVHSQEGELIADGLLAAALEQKASGQMVGQSGGARVQVKGTFRSRAGDVCREYGLAHAGNFLGVACRQDGGGWRVELHNQVAHSVIASGAVPASGGGEAYGMALDAMRDGDAFDAAAEAEVMKGWRTR